ncbi:MAG: hypothetical protein M3R08_04685, partial [Bacteroidota bacterium]|nr:hypothetical protein [Bacteroidota bacterium]
MEWHQIITLLVLGFIAWEDLGERSIHWWWLPLLMIGLVVPVIIEGSISDHLSQSGFNLSFLGLQFTALLLLLLLRYRRWVDPFRFIGLGDVLFFLVLAITLSPANFLLFYLTGLAFCVPAYILLVKWHPRTQRTIPTAGLMSMYLIIWSIVDIAG